MQKMCCLKMLVLNKSRHCDGVWDMWIMSSFLMPILPPSIWPCTLHIEMFALIIALTWRPLTEFYFQIKIDSLCTGTWHIVSFPQIMHELCIHNILMSYCWNLEERSRDHLLQRSSILIMVIWMEENFE